MECEIFFLCYVVIEKSLRGRELKEKCMGCKSCCRGGTGITDRNFDISAIRVYKFATLRAEFAFRGIIFFVYTNSLETFASLCKLFDKLQTLIFSMTNKSELYTRVREETVVQGMSMEIGSQGLYHGVARRGSYWRERDE